MQMSGKIGWIALTAMLLGAMLVVQFRSSAGDYNARQYQHLENVLDYYVQRSAQLIAMDQERSGLRKQILQFGKDQKNRTLQARLLRDEKIAGLKAVTGPGIQIQLQDSTSKLLPGEDVTNYLLHEEDLLGVVQDLVQAGAEVIAINNQRLVATSEIRCAGPTISVNKRRLSPPYRIYAIGNPDQLVRGVLKPNGRIQLLKLWKIQCQVWTNRQLGHLISIPEYTATLNVHYAKPVGQGGLE